MEKLPRQVYTTEFRQQAVELVTRDGLSLAEASRRLSLSPKTLTNWVRRAKNSGSPDGAAPAPRREVTKAPQSGHASGAWVMIRSGCADGLRVTPRCWGWPPGLRPDFFLRLLVRGTFCQGGSVEGGKEELCESRTMPEPRSTSRSNSRRRRRSLWLSWCSSRNSRD